MARMSGWMISTPKHDFDLNTFAQTREECIDLFMETQNGSGGAFQWWADQRTAGYDCIEVTINEAVRVAPANRMES